MHIPAVTNEAISPARLLRQLRETSNEQVTAPAPSATVSLSTDGRLASLVARMLDANDQHIDVSAVARLIGQSPMFAEAASRLPLPDAGAVDDGRAVATEGIGRGGFDPVRLATLLQDTPQALGVLRAAMDSNGLAALLQQAAGGSEALPASVQLYIDNGGIAGVRLDAARQTDLFARSPLP